MKQLWFQTDISMAGYEYRHAEVEIFETNAGVEIEDIYNPEPLITWQGQTNRSKEGDKPPFIPRDLRVNTIENPDEWCEWYGGRMTVKCQFFNSDRFAKAARLLKKMQTVSEEINREDLECVERDSLRRVITILRRLKAVPIRYGNAGKYERM